MDSNDDNLVTIPLSPLAKEDQIDEESTIIRKGLKQYIDTPMVPLKLAYTFFFGSLGAWLPYIIVFLMSVGLTPFESGLVSAMRTLVSSFTIPIWTFLADCTGRRTLIMVLVSVGIAATIIPAPFVAAHLRNDSNDALFSNTTMRPNQIGKNITNDTSYHYTNEPLESMYCTSLCGDKRMFYGMLILFIIRGLFEFSVSAFMDSYAMVIIEHNPRKTSFGKQRVFGAAGFAVGSFIAGVSSDHFSQKYLTKYAAIFFVYLPLAVIGIPFFCIVTKQADKLIKAQKKEKKKGANDLIWQVLKTCAIPWNFIFLLTVFVQGTTMNFKYSFMFVHMKDNMDATATSMGLSIVAGNIAEVIMFPFTHFLIKRFGGVQCLMFSLFVNSGRYFMLAYIENAWLALPVELLHSVGFALCYAAIVEIVYKISATEIVGTMFGIVNALNFTLTSVIGSMLGGYMYGVFGGKMFFIIIGGIMGGWGVIGSLFFLISFHLSRES